MWPGGYKKLVREDNLASDKLAVYSTVMFKRIKWRELNKKGSSKVAKPKWSARSVPSACIEMQAYVAAQFATLHLLPEAGVLFR